MTKKWKNMIKCQKIGKNMIKCQKVWLFFVFFIFFISFFHQSTLQPPSWDSPPLSSKDQLPSS